MQPLSLSDFVFDLPPERIAQEPARYRDDSLMLVVERASDIIKDLKISNFTDLVQGDELIVLNDVRVSHARLLGHKDTGGAVEILVLNAHEPHVTTARVMARSSKPLRPDARLLFGGINCRVSSVLGAGRYDLELPPGHSVETFIDAAGELPLPPYIARPDGPLKTDLNRYQTVFARAPGAVAAPTAGLHFTPQILSELRRKGCEIEAVTLYVGPGTFQPVRTEAIEEHRMHSEVFDIPEQTATAVRRARLEERKVLAVGTTVVRALEGAAALSSDGLPLSGRHATNIFIRPGFSFKVVDQLLTNFHLPGSTLLMLVAAMAGYTRMQDAYAHALRGPYRFFSYGDAMLIR